MRRLEDFALLEADMRSEQFGETPKRFGIRVSKCIGQTPQLGMVGQGTFDQRVVARLCKDYEEAQLLDAKMRIEFDRECLDHALRERGHGVRFAVLGSMPHVARKS